MSDFDWHGGKDADAIILQYQPPTAVYSSKAGNVVIRQKADESEEYDPQILLTSQGALAIAWALIEEAHLIGLPEIPGSLMVESEHWPPSTRRTDTPAQDGPRIANEDEAGPLLKAMRAAE